MKSPELNTRLNNFDAIRLFAACQVFLFHMKSYFNLKEAVDSSLFNSVIGIIGFFPGVPIFFIMSGFLISKSFKRNPDIITYARNRALRLYPGIWVCLAISLLLVVMSGYFSEVDIKPMSFGIWLSSEILFTHVYSSSLFDGYGTGVLNGALWILPIQIQFYVFFPILLFFLGRIEKRTRETAEKGVTDDIGVGRKGNEGKIREGGNRTGDVIIVGLLIASVVTDLLLNRHNILSLTEGSLVAKAVDGFLLNYLYMFLTGILIERNFNTIKDLIKGKAHLWLIFYIISGLVLDRFGIQVNGRGMNYVSFGLLSMTLMSVAYSKVNVSSRLLGGTDISFALYIYHMPVINYLIEIGHDHGIGPMLLAIWIVVPLAYLSTKLVEERALKMKRYGEKKSNKQYSN